HCEEQRAFSLDGISLVTSGIELRRVGRLCREKKREPTIGARRGFGFARRYCFVWCRAGCVGIHAGLARRMGHGWPDLLCRLRDKSIGSLQRDGRGAERPKHGQSEV